MKTIDNDNRANKSKGRPRCGAKGEEGMSLELAEMKVFT